MPHLCCSRHLPVTPKATALIRRHQQPQHHQTADTETAAAPPGPAATPKPQPAPAPSSTVVTQKRSAAPAAAPSADGAKALASQSNAATDAPKAVPGAHSHPMAQAVPPAPKPTAQTVVSEGDAARGRQVYKKCQACHSLEPGKNGLGPTLADIVGQKAAHVANYNYSPAMKSSGLTWDVATLDRYLADPQKVVPGNRMPFPGLKTENERNSVIAYLVATAGGAAGDAAVPSPTTAAPSPDTTAQQPSPAPARQAAPRSAASGTPELFARHQIHAANRYRRRPDGFHRRRRRH